MSKFISLSRAGSLAACIAIFGGSMAPTVAMANGSTSTAILVGAIVGTLIFDSSRHQYYYSNGGNREYVSNSTAQSYYQRQDPTYFRSHQSDFNNNPQKFNNDYRTSHHPRP
ncbi:MAG: hypothetical protein ABR949_01610 [Candidatus Aquilonibacter sp.]|jgi:hypothetical protein